MATNLITSHGVPYPLGCSIYNGITNFALYAEHASSVALGLFRFGEKTPDHILDLMRTKNHWHISISSMPEGLLYAYRINENPTWLIDPYAKILSTPTTWAEPSITPVLGFIDPPSTFNWAGVTHPNIPVEDLIIYEMHVRGFTVHSSSKTKSPGTYSAIIEKIPYFKNLGVNALEFMPMFEFDENFTHCVNPTTLVRLQNYWGYDPISYFAPKRNYSSDLSYCGALTEFKTLVKALHENGIEVILDVVYNHTAKSSLQGIDKKTYYMVDSEGLDIDYTGCKNTINTNNVPVQELILKSLRYWVDECRVDGFRFDLASVLTRSIDGHPLDPSPLIQAIKDDPILSKRKLISEPWDAVGLYQLGAFPKWGPWSEWNGKYRDIVRRFIKGFNDVSGLFANSLFGSDFIYHQATPLASVNFITAHDGFCLRDLVTYQSKHNLANGEKNNDGCTHNDSWNCGIEGVTKDPHILELRERQMRNFWLALLVSQGIPMILMGDEYGHTRYGNNNPYVQDNELNWFLWDELEKNSPIFHYLKNLIAFRKKHPALKQTQFLRPGEIDWHGHKVYTPDWTPTSRFVAFSTKGEKKLYIAFNAHHLPADVELPEGVTWQTIVNTQYGWDQQWFNGQGPILGRVIHMPAHAAVLAIGLVEPVKP